MSIYPKKRNPRFYRRLWEQYHCRPIPKDEFGRTFEIHHIDGDYTNNSIENLLAVSIQEHYDIHESQGDWGACLAIATRMRMPSGFLSELASKLNRKKVDDGTHHWIGGFYVKERIRKGIHNLQDKKFQEEVAKNNKKVQTTLVSLGLHHWQTPEHAESVRQRQTGKHHDDETKNKLSIKALERELRPEIKEIRKRPKPISVCPDCNKKGARGHLKRWGHFTGKCISK